MIHDTDIGGIHNRCAYFIEKVLRDGFGNKCHFLTGGNDLLLLRMIL